MLSKLSILLVIFFFNLSASIASPIISAISHNKINIGSDFNGATILLFGTQKISGDIVILLKGEKKDFIIDKKDKIFGIWYNKDRVKIKNAYNYYALFNESGKRKTELHGELKLNQYHNLNPKVPQNFSEAFAKIMKKRKLYQINKKDIIFLNETLFKVTLSFPKNIPQGTYSVEIYLISENNLLAFQTIPIYINKIGLNAKVNHMAHNQPYIYASISILMAVILGWLANVVFNKLFK